MSTQTQASQRDHSIPPPKQPEQADGKPRKASISGVVVKDPELRYTSAGKPVVTLRVVVKDRIKNETTGQWEDANVRFFDVKVWNNLGERTAEAMQKGDRVVVMGTWTQEHWKDKNGDEQERWIITAEDVGASLLWKDVRIHRTEQLLGS